MSEIKPAKIFILKNREWRTYSISAIILGAHITVIAISIRAWVATVRDGDMGTSIHGVTEVGSALIKIVTIKNV